MLDFSESFSERFVLFSQRSDQAARLASLLAVQLLLQTPVLTPRSANLFTFRVSVVARDGLLITVFIVFA